MIRGKEAQVVKSIKLTLALYVPQVIWIDRLQSGTVRAGANWIHMCKPGTPDLYAIVKEGGGHVVFIECKAPHGGYQSIDQKMFMHKIAGFKNVHYVLARSVGEVAYYIRRHITEASLLDQI